MFLWYTHGGAFLSRMAISAPLTLTSNDTLTVKPYTVADKSPDYSLACSRLSFSSIVRSGTPVNPEQMIPCEPAQVPLWYQSEGDESAGNTVLERKIVCERWDRFTAVGHEFLVQQTRMGDFVVFEFFTNEFKVEIYEMKKLIHITCCCKYL